MVKKKLIALAMAGFMAASVVYVPGGENNFVYGAEVSDDFEIEDGTLTGYKGNGGVVVIPAGVKKIGRVHLGDAVI